MPASIVVFKACQVRTGACRAEERAVVPSPRVYPNGEQKHNVNMLHVETNCQKFIIRSKPEELSQRRYCQKQTPEGVPMASQQSWARVTLLRKALVKQLPDKQSTSKPMNQLTSKPLSQDTSQPGNQVASQLVNQLTRQPVNQQTS